MVRGGAACRTPAAMGCAERTAVFESAHQGDRAGAALRPRRDSQAHGRHADLRATWRRPEGQRPPWLLGRMAGQGRETRVERLVWGLRQCGRRGSTAGRSVPIALPLNGLLAPADQIADARVRRTPAPTSAHARQFTLAGGRPELIATLRRMALAFRAPLGLEVGRGTEPATARNWTRSPPPDAARAARPSLCDVVLRGATVGCV